ncbi:MAG: bifunctional precorrin-2 dehydrogenase/sirohydrochlorin ferrochelatase [Acidobacteria bacterium]|nr:bifunctional precorrin-2 dehydrogenase/sirohydrochlorin ferrochelatase [Acidobacteriota bacterium]
MNYPIYLRLQNRPILLVGGGSIAWQKWLGIKTFGAKVTVVATHFNADFENESSEHLSKKQRSYQASDLAGQVLVFAATNDPEVNHQVVGQARELGIWANAVDDPPFCDFYVPAQVVQGPLQVAISSNGTSPTLTKQIKQRIQNEILTPDMAVLAELLGQFRPRVQNLITGFQNRKRFWEKVMESPVPELVKNGDARSAQLYLEFFLENRAEVVHA